MCFSPLHMVPTARFARGLESCRCPWHGWDYHPCDGKAPGHDDGLETYQIKLEGDAVFVGLESEPEHETTVSDIMMETMTNWGVDTVFGMVGHSNLGVADAMRRQEEKGKLSFYGIRHEGAASFAASAYGKLTGRPAACFAIAGPGATNMYTGMWDAKVDRAPLLALSGQGANMSEMRFDTKSIKVPAGKELTVALENQSTDATMPHNIAFIQEGTANEVGQGGLSFKENGYVNPDDKNVIAHSPVVQIGETKYFTFTTPAAGDYAFICSYPGHWGMMKGKFITE